MFRKRKQGLKLERQNVLEGHHASIYTLTDIPGSEKIISGGGEGWLVEWNKFGLESNGKLIAKVEGQIFSTAFLPSKNILLVGDMHGHLYWIDLENYQIIKRQFLHKGSIFSIKVYENKVYTCGADGVLCCLNTDLMLPELSIQISTQGLRCLEMVQKNLWIGGSDKSIRILDMDTLELSKHMKAAHRNTVFSLYYDGKNTIYSGGRDAILTRWDEEKGTAIQSLPAHWYTINAIIGIQPDRILTCSRDKTVRLWQSENMELLYAADSFKGGHIRSVNTGIYIKESSLIATAGDDRTIILWKISEQ